MNDKTGTVQMGGNDETGNNQQMEASGTSRDTQLGITPPSQYNVSLYGGHMRASVVPVDFSLITKGDRTQQANAGYSAWPSSGNFTG